MAKLMSSIYEVHYWLATHAQLVRLKAMISNSVSHGLEKMAAQMTSHNLHADTVATAMNLGMYTASQLRLVRALFFTHLVIWRHV